MGGDNAVVHMKDLCGEFPDEVDIVTDEDQRSLVGSESHDQGFDGVDVEVGCGLVHEEEVWRIDEEFYKIQPGLLPSAQDRGFLEDVILAKEEGAENAPGIIFGEFAIGGLDLVEDRFVRVERGRAVLAEVTDLRIRAFDPFSFLEL